METSFSGARFLKNPPPLPLPNSAKQKIAALSASLVKGAVVVGARVAKGRRVFPFFNCTVSPVYN
jgi:hypothetical protein